MNRQCATIKFRLASAGLLASLCPHTATAGQSPSFTAPIAVPASFASAIPGGASQVAPVEGGAWWKVFCDPTLDTLIARLHAGNTSIRQSAAHLASAQARAHLGKASQMPTLGANGSASHAGGPLINQAGGSGNLFTAGLSLSWEVDLLGKYSGQRKAERLDARAAEALLRDTRLLMEAETARAYFQSLYLQQAQDEAVRAAQLWQEREAIARTRLTSGLGQPLDSEQLHRRSIASASEAALLARDLAQARDRLAFLVGDPVPVSVAAHSLPSPPEVPSGLPSEVLARRPDVQAAIDRLQAADGRLVSARRQWFPSLSLTGSGGVASPSLGQILSSSAQNFGLGLLFSLPLFDGGRHKAQVAASAAELDFAKAQYSEVMLGALHEVNDALAAVQATARQSQLDGESLASREREQAIDTSRAANGTMSRALLIEAQLATSAQRLAALNADYQRLAAAIDMVKAIGGGWSGEARD
jgi:outer membrane protein, multidrug efflux system